MRRHRLVFSCRPSSQGNDITCDDVLILQFNEWRLGTNEYIFGNEVIQPGLFHERRRTPREIWAKAEEYVEKAKGDEAKRFFINIVERFKEITIYGKTKIHY